MHKQNRRIISILNMIIDVMLIFASYYFALYIRFILMKGHVSLNLWGYPYNILAFIFSLSLVICYAIFGLYNIRHVTPHLRESIIIMLINGIVISCFTLLLFMAHIETFSRLVLIFTWCIVSFVIIFKRIINKQILAKSRIFAFTRKKVLLVGNGKLAFQYANDVQKNQYLGINIVGCIGNKKNPMPTEYLGEYKEIYSILDNISIDEIVVGLDADEVYIMKNVIEYAEKNGTRISIIPFFNDYFSPAVSMDSIGKTQLIDVMANPLDNVFFALIKRFFDFVGAIILIVLTSPIMIMAIIGVKLSSPGRIFFKQKRVGLNKKTFYMLKFRSMKENNAEKTGWSCNTDTRRTKFGSFIRKFSIDELPQLFNVLKGDMSLVGPRPEIPHFVRKFKEDVPLYMLRQLVRPGMTGWAQIHGLRGDTSIEKRVDYDIWYIQNWSFWLDIEILVRTALGGFINSETIVKKKLK